MVSLDLLNALACMQMLSHGCELNIFCCLHTDTDTDVGSLSILSLKELIVGDSLIDHNCNTFMLPFFV